MPEHVNIRDRNTLSCAHPEVYMSTFGIGIRSLALTLKYTVSFEKGNLFHKTPNVSSGMPVDQTHEQNIKIGKGPQYAVGIIESHCA